MEIVWSKLAYEHFLEILIYVENNFGMLTAQKTRQKIQDKVNLLAKHPYIGDNIGESVPLLSLKQYHFYHSISTKIISESVPQLALNRYHF